MIIKIANKAIERNRVITNIFPVDVPPAPIALPATDITLSSFFSNWYSTVPVAGYYLDVAKDINFTSFVPGFNNFNIPDETSTYFIPDLSCGEDYFYRVRAYYQPGHTSANSNIITAYTLSLDKPILLAATDVSFSSFTINWSPVTNALGYRVDVDNDANFSSPVYNNVDVGNTLSYLVQDLSSLTTYYYRIRAYNEECISENSDSLSTTTLGITLDPPIATAATDVSYNSFSTNWITVSGATGYRLYVSTDPLFSTHLPGFNGLDVGNTSTYPVTGLVENTTYYYRLDAYNNYTTSVYSNIISVTTNIQVFNACYDFDPHYASIRPTTGFLDVDSIISNTATISTYVIEWRLNSSTGQTVFISGVGSDPSIQAQHPFANPEVVFAGTLYPVIKYMYFNGIKYTTIYEEGARYSPDLIECLDPIVVEPVTCSTILGTDALYPYYLTYLNERDTAADKSRKIKFNLSPNTIYLGWEFQAYDVAEQLKIYYCTSTNEAGVLLDNFIIGTRNETGGGLVNNLYPTNYPTNPRIIYNSRNYGIKYLTNLQPFLYSTGNYLRIEIVGSILEPLNVNTNWYIKLKCFSADDISCAFYDSSISKLNTNTGIDPSITFVTGSNSCIYQMSYYTLKDASNLNKSNIRSYDPWLWKYTNMNIMNIYTNRATNNMANPVYQGVYWYDRTANSWIWYGPGIYTCQNLAPNQTITVTRTKDPSTVVFSFTDINDYNAFVSDIQSIQSDPDYATWQSLTYDDVRKYGYYYLYWNDASSCGDTQYISSMYFHLASSISYDSFNRTITFTPYIPTMSSAILDTSANQCDTTYNVINSNIITMRYTMNGPAAFHYTKVRMQNPISASWPFTMAVHETSEESYQAFYIDNAMLNGVCNLGSLGFIYDLSTSSIYRTNFTKRWVLFKWWDKFTLTNPTDHSSRLNNWRLERKIFLRTDSSIDTGFETVYDVSNGIFLIGG